MIELLKYFRILFLSSKISRERLKDFTENHILNLTAHNPGGIFTAILTAVTTAYNNYYGDMSSEAVNLAVQEGTTVAMNESRKALENQLSDNEKLVAYTYRNNKNTYEEFYPLGLTEYNDADLGTFDTITERYKNVLASHAGDFTAGFVTDYNTARALFKTSRQAQQTAMSNVANERSDMNTTRPALALQLTTNLLTIALQYVGDESKCDVYFDQSILNAAFTESERKVVATIEPGETINVFDNITRPEVQLMVKNNGIDTLYLHFMATDSTPVPVVEDTAIPPGEVRGANAGEAGWTNATRYLNITNPSGGIGSFSVEKV